VDVADAILGDTGLAEGVSWGDYDGDGDLDLYVANDDGANLLLWNDGLGQFTEDTVGDIADTGHGLAVSWGDYDNDGDPDLYLARLIGENLLFRNDGSGSFTDVTAPPLGVTAMSRSAPWVDYDNDGHLDLYVVNESGGSNVLLRNMGDGTFVDATSSPLDHSGLGNCVAWGDYDNDGDPDAYLANWGQPNVLFRNDGGGSFADVTSAPLDDAGQATSVCWGDSDNDGDLDLYVCNAQSANRLFRNDGGGVFTDVTSGPLGSTDKGIGAGWSDFDNDGDLDLYIANYGVANLLLVNDGGEVFSDGTVFPLDDPGHGGGVTWGDYDGDGDTDLYVANGGEANLLLENSASLGNHWLHLELEGTVSNRSAIGARVRVVAGGVSQIREITGGSGYASQASPAVEFGLAGSALVDTLVIRWPSGVVNVYTGVGVDQVLEIVENPPPSRPEAVVAFPGPEEASITVEWSAVTDPQLDYYRIERDTTDAFSAGMAQFTSTDSLYIDCPLCEEREYYYRVFAVGVGGNESDASDTVSCSPLQTPPPAPVGLTAVGIDGTIDLSWSPVAVPDFDRYRVDRDTTSLFGASALEFTTSDTVYTDMPVENGQTYYYRVLAFDCAGLASVPSDTIFCVAVDLPPSVPVGLAVVGGTYGILLDWIANPEPDIVGYIVYRDTDSSIDPADSLITVTTNSYVDSSANFLETHWYCLRAIDAAGSVSDPGDTVDGFWAPAHAVYVDDDNTGVELGTYDHPYNTVQEGIDAADEGGCVAIMPGFYGEAVTLQKDIVVAGVSGAPSTVIVSVDGAVLSASWVTDLAMLVGLTLEGWGSASTSIDCSYADVVVKSCVIRGATTGANIHWGSAPTFENNTFLENYTAFACSDSAHPVLSGNAFSASTFAHVTSSGDPGPLLGGSVLDANDFLGTALFGVFNSGSVEVLAAYNYWGSDCPDSTWFYGPVSYTPWTDSTHVEIFTECPGTGIEDNRLPHAFALSHGFPNPFNPVTRVVYDVPAPGGPVSLRVYSQAGRLVRTLVDELAPPGRHVAEWDGTNESGASVASGVYFCRYEAEDFADQRKIVLLK